MRQGSHSPQRGLGPEASTVTTYDAKMNWTASKTPPVHEGQTYGQKDVEFLRFLGLPDRVAPTALELAVHAGKRRQAPLDLLQSRGWRVVDPKSIADTPDAGTGDGRHGGREAHAVASVSRSTRSGRYSGWLVSHSDVRRIDSSFFLLMNL